MTVRGLPDSIAALAARIHAPGRADPRKVIARIDRLTKPPGSLGALERLAGRLALLVGDPPPSIFPATVFVLAADHGVTEERDAGSDRARPSPSAYPRAVTAQMCRNFSAGGAAIHAIAGSVGAEVVVADFGVDAEIGELAGVLSRKIRRGTRDLRDGPAMTREEAERAVLEGASLVADRSTEVRAVALGEMGIGNTTAASALTAARTGASAEAVVGAGSGVDRTGLERKVEGVERALSRRDPTNAPFDDLVEYGGLEIAGLVGVALAAAAEGIPIVTDGFIATSATLVATQVQPRLREYVFAGHRSLEPGHRVQLEYLGLDPILDLDLRLGEGTGAALSLPILDAACAMLREMATFESAGVSGGPAR